MEVIFLWDAMIFFDFVVGLIFRAESNTGFCNVNQKNSLQCFEGMVSVFSFKFLLLVTSMDLPSEAIVVEVIFSPFFNTKILCLSGKEDVPVHGLSEVIVGVLGGGQLGRMLCQAASKMAIKVMVLDPTENCPASALAYDHMVGSFDDSATVQEFAKRFRFFELIFFYAISFFLYFF